MSGFWTSTSFSGSGLIDIEDANPAEFFPSSPDVPSDNGGASAGKSDANYNSPYDVLDHHPDGLDRLVPRREYSLAAVAFPNPPRADLFHQGIYRGITKATLLSTNNYCLLDATEKEVVTKGCYASRGQHG